MQEIFENWRGYRKKLINESENKEADQQGKEFILEFLEEIGDSVILGALGLGVGTTAAKLSAPIARLQQRYKAARNPGKIQLLQKLNGPIIKVIGRATAFGGLAVLANDIYRFFIAENNEDNIREFHDTIAGLLGLPTHKEQPCWRKTPVPGFPRCRD